MANFDKNRFASAKQDWETPLNIFDPLNKEFGFTQDVCATRENRKTQIFIGPPEDAMKVEWGKNVSWINPPYGKGYPLSQWVRRAYEQSQNGTIVMLIPARTNTNWFHDVCLKYGEVRFIKGRPKFGGATHGLPQPLCVVIFRNRRKPNDIHRRGFEAVERGYGLRRRYYRHRQAQSRSSPRPS